MNIAVVIAIAYLLALGQNGMKRETPENKIS